MFLRDVLLQTGPNPPLLLLCQFSLKGAESPGSGHVGVMGTLVYFLPSEVVGARCEGALGARCEGAL